jgi:transcriptional regulator with XRE-family HTH domain
MARTAGEVRLRLLRERAPVDTIVDAIRLAVPNLFPLEAWRIANGWTRAEVSARLDALYRDDDLAPPGISSAELCRWEHDQRRPNDERLEYLCRLYGTRPDRLGFGTDHSPADVDHLRQAGLTDLWPHTNEDSLEDLVTRLRAARSSINLFGLTRNFYARDEVLPIFEAKAVEIPVRFYVMDPWCESRRDRYRIEPGEAAMEDPRRYAREVLRPLEQAAQRVAPAARPGAGLQILTYNFPCSFAIEQIDDACRVMLYGHGRRGTDGPILVFEQDSPYRDFFDGQIRWLDRLATDPREPWITKGLVVRPLRREDLDGAAVG